MLPILTKPLLQYAVEEALSANITNMAIVTNKNKRAIEDHFDQALELELQINGTQKEELLKEINTICNYATFTYVRQKQMLGLGYAILTGKPLIGNEPFAVHLVDDLCISEKGNSLLYQMIKIYNKYQCSIVAIEEVPMNQIHKYGVIVGDLINNTNDTYRITNMIEKPTPKNAPTNMAIIGRYILTPDILISLKKLNQTRMVKFKLPMHYLPNQNKVTLLPINLKENVLTVAAFRATLKQQTILLNNKESCKNLTYS